MSNWLPFWAYPMAWHLHGAERARAKAVYELEGDDLDRALLSIDYDPDSQEYALRLLDIDRDAGVVSNYDYEIRRNTVLLSGIERDVAKVEIDHAYGMLTDQEAEKITATLKKEAWVGGPIKYEGDGGVEFDLDWNEYWIEELRANGYTGATDHEIMKKWFAALCFSEVIATTGEDGDPFFLETAKATLNRLVNKD